MLLRLWTMWLSLATFYYNHSTLSARLNDDSSLPTVFPLSQGAGLALHLAYFCSS